MSSSESVKEPSIAALPEDNQAQHLAAIINPTIIMVNTLENLTQNS
ncbi:MULTISPECIES: hypothetical protein [Pseudoalteromonas]|nr:MULTISPECIES: hypothetical protein [Pseudoalteromonas]MCG9758653.1 hypothetical protein [Pseudoalteromonas sp. Isolate6]